MYVLFVCCLWCQKRMAPYLLKGLGLDEREDCSRPADVQLLHKKKRRSKTQSEAYRTRNTSRHDEYLHALLQLFHQAVKMDMQNTSAGVERRWLKEEKGKELHFWFNQIKRRNGVTVQNMCVCEKLGVSLNSQLAQWMPWIPTPSFPHSRPSAYFPAGIHLGMHMGAAAEPG